MRIPDYHRAEFRHGKSQRITHLIGFSNGSICDVDSRADGLCTAMAKAAVDIVVFERHPLPKSWKR